MVFEISKFRGSYRTPNKTEVFDLRGSIFLGCKATIQYGEALGLQRCTGDRGNRSETPGASPYLTVKGITWPMCLQHPSYLNLGL